MHLQIRFALALSLLGALSAGCQSSDTSDSGGTGAHDAAAGVKRMFAEIGLTPGLAAAGVRADQLDALADQAFADGCHATNPVPVTREDLRRLYEQSM